MILAAFCSAAQAGVVVTAPTVNAANQTAANTAAAQLQTKLNNEIFNQLSSMPKLARGFNNANVAAMNAGSNQSFQNYDIFSIQVGGALGLAIKDSSGDDLKNTGDTYAGAAAQGAVNVGINTSSFLMKDLYLNLKYGAYSVGDSSDVWKGRLFGIGANYSYIADHSIGFGLLRWRGISFGTGLTIATTTLDAEIDYSDKNVVYSGVTLTARDTEADLHIKTTSFVVPVEAVTSIQVLWLANLGIGGGVDLVKSNTKISMTGKSAIYASGAGVTQTSPGSISGGSSNKSKPKFFDAFAPKLLASAGLNLGPVKIDMPVAYYFCTPQTFSIGINVGFVW
jgi:hypothetical protein